MKIKDDRQIDRRIYPAWSLFWLKRLPTSQRKRIETRLVNLGAVNHLEISVLFPVGGAILLAVVLLSFAAKPSVMVFLILAYQIGIYSLGEYAHGDKSRRSMRAAAIRRVMLAEERCASCAYPLVGLQVEADGCTVCPECGAAWRLDPTDIAGTRALSGATNHPPATTAPPHTTTSTGFPPNS